MATPPTTTKHKSNGPGGLGFSRTGKLTHTENATARLLIVSDARQHG
jgi:hypothetical protein